MPFSTIDWSIYNFTQIAKLIIVDEGDVVFVFDRAAGFHMVDGACSKSKHAIIERVASMLFTYMEGGISERQAYGPDNELLLPATFEQISDAVKSIIDQMNIEWSSPKVKDLR
ncbi:MAG: hypothetical protein EB059_04335 [Alphaproteobacteria bacterium]|nr:hypothetical protein [Alphaproteobacteria bacterium]